MAALTMRSLLLVVATSCVFCPRYRWAAFGFSLVPPVGRVPTRPRGRMSSPLPAVVDANSLLDDLDTFWKTSPYTAAALVCGVKASFADGVAQFKEWKEQQPQETQLQDEVTTEGADVARNLAFVTYGALYQGLTQEVLYNHIYPVWFGTGSELTVVASKVLFSLLVQTPLLTLPSLYAIKAVIEHQSFEQALQKYVDDIRHQQLLQKFYLLWGPVLTIVFSVIPSHLRVTTIAVVSFFWLIVLSQISSGQATSTDIDNSTDKAGDRIDVDRFSNTQSPRS